MHVLNAAKSSVQLEDQDQREPAFCCIVKKLVPNNPVGEIVG